MKITIMKNLKIINLFVGIIVGLNACSTQSPAPVRSYQHNNYNDNQVVGKGYYKVQSGDTLYRIALEHGQDYKDIVAWNNIQDPNHIVKGSVLRVAPPDSTTKTTITNSVANTNEKVEVKTLSNNITNTTNTTNTTTTNSETTTAKVVNKNIKTYDNIDWSWPTTNKLTASFSANNKGMEFTGKSGDAILAAADGKVVYAGNGLRGYGELVIVKHNATYLTAYGHNRKILVKEGQSVKRGQKIAEMGNTDTDKVKLHFELRKQGNPINPASYLPSR